MERLDLHSPVVRLFGFVSLKLVFSNSSPFHHRLGQSFGGNACSIDAMGGVMQEDRYFFKAFASNLSRCGPCNPSSRIHPEFFLGAEAHEQDPSYPKPRGDRNPLAFVNFPAELFVFKELSDPAF